MLSRLLSVAAAATAASLVGNTERAFSEAHDVAGSGVDGSFEGFLRALQNGSLAAALRNGGNEMGADAEAPAGSGGFTPVNFFRMFRFGATEASTAENSGTSTPTGESVGDSTSSETSASSHDDAATSTSTSSGAPDSRMIPVIIVGIRSVTPTPGLPQGDGFATPPLFDALSNLPLNLPNGLPRGGSGTLMRRTDRRGRSARSRRASMSAVNYDGPRPHMGSVQPTAERGTMASSTLPSVLTDTPPGPHPPPSTPADYHGLSAYPSGNSTPSRRPSSSSGGSLPLETLPTWREAALSSHIPTTERETTIEGPASSAYTQARRRRLRDSAFARHRDLGSGSSRRNGFVGDSDATSGNRPPPLGATHEGTRSWIIYVLGGSYPEDHPILTTPSLFTDSPTYEDMLLLASILGPAKPPVATEEEIASAPAAYHVRSQEGSLIAERAGVPDIVLSPGDRCLVCLCDYEVTEEVRQLTKCGHLYHRTCIDEVRSL